ncbi:TonB-dependent receptor [Campylobacter coli]
MKKFFYISLITSCLLAQETDIQTYSLDKVVVAGDEVNDDVVWDILELEEELPTRSVSVVSQKDILSKGGSGGVQGLLESVPGIMYSRSGGVGGQLSVRGMNSNNSRSIIAIDGVRVTGRSTLELNMIDPNSLEGIEVIRGSASSLYGSNAINGVINFKTRRYEGDVNQPFKMDAKIRALEFNSVNAGFGGRAELLGGGDGWDVLFGIHGRKGDDFRTPEGIAKNSKYQSYGTDFNIGYTMDNIRYYTQGKFQKINTYNAGGIHAKPGSYYGIVRNEDPMYEYYIRGGVEVYDLKIADKMDAYLYWRHYDTDLWIDRRSIGESFIHQFVHNTNQVGGALNFNKEIDRHSLGYGLSVLSAISPTPTKQINQISNQEVTTSRSTIDTEIAAYIKDDYRLNDNWILSSSLRYDYIITQIGSNKFTNETQDMTDFLNSHKKKTSGALTGSIGALYYINDKIALIGNVSQNFKSPGTTGLFPSATSEANHDLKPEYAQTYEIGGRYQEGNNYGSLVFFRTDYTDMIQNTNIGGGKVQARNIGKAYIQGIEFESHHRIMENWLVDIVAAYNYGQDKTADKPLAYIAPLYGNLALGYEFNWGYIKWIQKAYLGKNRIDSTQERETSSYTITDINVGVDLKHFNKEWKDMQLTFGVENLFNQKGRNPTTAEDIAYARALTNPLLEPGINAFVKFAYKY